MRAKITKEEEYPVYHLLHETEGDSLEVVYVDDWLFLEYVNVLREWRAVQEKIREVDNAT